MCSHRSNCIVPPLRTCAAVGVSALYHCCLHNFMQPWENLHCSTHEYMCNHRNKHIIQSLNTCAATELKHALQHHWIHNYNFITHYITAALEIQSVLDCWEDFHFFPILCTLLGQNMKNTRLKKKSCQISKHNSVCLKYLLGEYDNTPAINYSRNFLIYMHEATTVNFRL